MMVHESAKEYTSPIVAKGSASFSSTGAIDVPLVADSDGGNDNVPSVEAAAAAPAAAVASSCFEVVMMMMMREKPFLVLLLLSVFLIL